jgi:hypothetical protein
MLALSTQPLALRCAQVGTWANLLLLPSPLGLARGPMSHRQICDLWDATEVRQGASGIGASMRMLADERVPAAQFARAAEHKHSRR